MAKSIRIALVNDYMIVLEGLRALIESSDSEITIVELDVRKGPTCPGTEVPMGCAIGYLPSRSYLDLNLDAANATNAQLQSLCL